LLRASDDRSVAAMRENVRGGQSKMLRVSTGIQGMDAILGGGLFKAGIYIFAGRPGAGKTVLGNQVAFHHVANQGRALYVTLLSETHDRMLANLRSFSFFREDCIGKSLSYVSGYGPTQKQKLDGLLTFLRQSVRAHGANLLVIDGMVMAESQAPSVFAYKKFIQDLQTWVGTFGCTVMLLASVRDYRAIQPEHTMVDGIFELRTWHKSARSVREIEVAKFRGSHFLEGRHTYRITTDGISIYPRAEAFLELRPPSRHVEPSQSSTGIAGLDQLLCGGLARGSTTLVLGPSGAGKTMLGLQFLEAGIDAEEPGLYFGFFETPAMIRAKANRIGLRIGEGSLVSISWYPAAEQFLDQLAHELLETVRRQKVQRIFIDGLRGFVQSAAHPERVPSFFAVLTEELNSQGATTLFSEETAELFVRRIAAPIPGISAICQNILFLQQVEIRAELAHLISVLKTRDSDHDPALYHFKITDRGLRVGRRFQPGVGKSVLKGGSARLRTSIESKGSRNRQKR
jgi:circadian clock protein KaiC